jgi:hypothetical protein
MSHDWVTDKSLLMRSSKDNEHSTRFAIVTAVMRRVVPANQRQKDWVTLREPTAPRCFAEGLLP